jgi:hypothetical protein
VSGMIVGYHKVCNPPVGAPLDQWTAFWRWRADHPEPNYRRVRAEKGYSLMNEITIQLRYDVGNDKGKEEIVKQAAKEAAKSFYTQILLISDGRKPQVSVFASDWFVGSEELKLDED